MREQKGKRVWKSMFLSYMLIILLCFGLFCGLVVFESYVSGKEQKERENQLKIQEAANAIDQRLIAAQSIASNINASSSIKKLYLSVINGKTLDSYTLREILNELKLFHTSTSRLDIEEVVLFADSYSKAYSSTGVLLLDEPPQNSLSPGPVLAVDSISNLLGFDARGKLSLVTTGFVYVSDYTYSSGNSTGASRGSVAVMFNLDALKADLEKIIGEKAGLRFYWRGEELISVGEMEGNVYERPLTNAAGGAYIEMYSKDSAFPATMSSLLVFSIFLILVLTVVFIVLAYYFSRKYYKPIGHIGQLVTEGAGTDNEMDDIILNIKTLIGERNGYREKMLTITPYAQQGLLHGVLTGSMHNDAVQILSSKNFLDLQKPFFAVCVLNFSAGDGDPALKMSISEICDEVCRAFSTEERRVYALRRDAFNYFLIMNSDIDAPLDDLLFQMHEVMSEKLSEYNCLLTIGADEVQDDINLMQETCTRAIKALDEMMVQGRGEVYFYEPPKEGGADNYCFPKNSDLKLIKYVRERRLDNIKEFLDEIYNKNIQKQNITPAALHALIDELHLTTLRCIKDSSDLGTVQIYVEKITTVSTLEEIFDYYYAVFEALINRVPAESGTEAGSGLSEAILKYVDENYYMPDMSLQLLTDKFGVSSKYISLIYKNQLGTTYLQNLHSKRIQRAVELLRAESCTLEQVGEMCGYTSPLTFRRNFKAYTGMTPSEYRDFILQNKDE